MVELIVQYQDAYLRGLLGTLKLAALSWLIGLTAGFLLGSVSFYKLPIIAVFIRGFNYLITSLPVIVILFWFHYPAQSMAGINISPFITSLVVLSIINTVSASVIVEHGFAQVKSEYLELAKLYGLKDRAIILKILLPMVVRNIAPSLITLQMLILHMTIFASLISYEELFRISQQINSEVYRPIEVFSILALFFLTISAPFVLYANRMKNAISRSF